MSHLDANAVWTHSRDSINLVVGAILGAYLGLSISRDGVMQGSYLDLFALITMTAFAVIGIVGAGNNWFARNYKLMIAFLVWLPISAGLSACSATGLGIDAKVLWVIYITWVWLIVMQISAYEVAAYLERKL
jgi:hypothetical protein